MSTTTSKVEVLDPILVSEVGSRRNPAHPEAVRLCDVHPGLVIDIYYWGHKQMSFRFTGTPLMVVRFNFGFAPMVSWEAEGILTNQGFSNKNRLWLSDVGIMWSSTYNGFNPNAYSLKAE